ncbi:hypothetical protein ACFYTQ_28135 [Nocardia sp. NPDC004068]|uniref:hypothetical protein n=1 Tax=Nocardia sp. NPDC004068 TaxID=3364303 RepID=UPI0036B7A952
MPSRMYREPTGGGVRHMFPRDLIAARERREHRTTPADRTSARAADDPAESGNASEAATTTTETPASDTATDPAQHAPHPRQ